MVVEAFALSMFKVVVRDNAKCMQSLGLYRSNVY